MGFEKLWLRQLNRKSKNKKKPLAERFISELDSYLIRSRVAERETQEAKTGGT